MLGLEILRLVAFEPRTDDSYMTTTL